MRYTVFKETDFAAAHFLREYHGKCEALHGHNYRVRLYVGADELDAEGMVLDFVALKRAMQQVIGRLDHANINELEPFDLLNPTAEHIARYIAEGVAAQVDDARVRVSECHVWETDRSCAIYAR
ncbi:MAG: 6-carboxytetrahydropterin synthase QueD [bacterium]|nr:6-carboxytetrahydropterin synthase QueD [bacterium]